MTWRRPTQAIPRGEWIRAREQKFLGGEIESWELRSDHGTHALPRLLLTSLHRNLQVQQHSVSVPVCFDGVPSLRSSPHSLGSLLERREGLPEQADAVLVVLAVLHEQDVQLVLDLGRHDGVEVVVGGVTVRRLG